MIPKFALASCVFVISSCAIVETERMRKADDIEFAQAETETNRHMDMWRAEQNFPVCTSDNLRTADTLSNTYEDDAIDRKYQSRRGIKVLPPGIGLRSANLRMSIADAAYAQGCLNTARDIYIDIHESYNNHLVDAYVSINKKARARIVDINQSE